VSASAELSGKNRNLRRDLECIVFSEYVYKYVQSEILLGTVTHTYGKTVIARLKGDETIANR
jgi:hypothetical protein